MIPELRARLASKSTNTIWLISVRTGFEFDLGRDRIMLDTRTRIGKSQGGGFGPTVQLDDGTLVTSYSYRGDDDNTHLEVVRWKAPVPR